MSWSAALSVTLGLVLLYLVFSVAASRINEFVATRLQWRAQGLERALYTLFGGAPLKTDASGVKVDGTPPAAGDLLAVSTQLSAQAVKDHPTIAAFDAVLRKGRRASYLPARAISAAVLDILAPPIIPLLDDMQANVPAASQSAFKDLRAHPDLQRLQAFKGSLRANDPLLTSTVPLLESAIQQDPMEQARTSVETLPADNPARRPMLRMLIDAQGERDVFRAKLERWYEDEMDRLSGWYKRRVQLWILVYGAALAIIFNLDSVSIAQTLWRSPVEQAAAAQAAANAAGKSIDSVDTSVSALRGLALPIGWTPAHVNPAGSPSKVSADPRHAPTTASQWLLKIAGLAITTLALSFGAPFWFDVLGKIARVRNAGNTPPRGGEAATA